MEFKDLLGMIADFLGIITAIVAVPAVLRFLFYEPKRRKTVERLMNDPSRNKSAVLSVGLGTKAEGMKTQVMAYVNGHPLLREQLEGELREGENFFPVEILSNCPEAAAEEGLYAEGPEKYLHGFRKDLDKVMVHMAQHGIKRVHLFYQGPAVLAAPLGAALSNRFDVTCYHKSNAIGYYAVGPLQEPLQ